LAQGSNEQPAEQDGESPDARRSINELGHRLKDLFEGKRWQEFGEGLGLPTLWFFDEPLALDEALSRAEARLGQARELEVTLERILSNTASGSEASGSYTCCLMWLEAEGWQQREVEFDLHLGFRKDGAHWRVSYAGITAATPDEVPFPDDAPAAGDPPSPADAHDDRVLVYVPAWVPADTARALLEAGAARSFDEHAGAGGEAPARRAKTP